MTFTFRRAEPADRPALWSICDKIWRGQDPLKAELDAWLTAPDRLMLAVEFEGRIVGCLGGRWLTPTEGWMGSLRKDPDVPVGGVARASTIELMRRMQAIQPVRQFRGSTSTDQRVQMHVLPTLGFQLIERRTLWLRAPTGAMPRRSAPVTAGDWAAWQAGLADRHLPPWLNLEWTVYDAAPETLRRHFIDRGGWLRLGAPGAPAAQALVWRDPRYHTVSWLDATDDEARARLLGHLEAEAGQAGVPVAFFVDGEADGFAAELEERGYAMWPAEFLLYEAAPPG
ncbi:MAG: hypothetical protein KC620_09125 [Myxococcales bacterium]|nr:hypothetical protein [Myxococcales bacterium]